MIDRFLNWLYKHTVRIVILLASVIVFVVTNNLIKDCQFKKEMKEQSIRWKKEGISSRTRSFHPCDTTKKDSIK